MTGALRLVSTVATALVVLGFALFAIDETREGSATTVHRIADSSGSSGEREREAAHGPVREAIDDANDVLLAPVDPVVEDSDSQWVRHGVPALLGFLLYGLLLRLVANALPETRRHQPLGWETPR